MALVLDFGMSEDGEDLLVPSIITDTLFLYKNSHS
jgi:hypothetical protein